MPLPGERFGDIKDPSSSIDGNDLLIDSQLWDDVLLGDDPAILRAEAGVSPLGDCVMDSFIQDAYASDLASDPAAHAVLQQCQQSAQDYMFGDLPSTQLQAPPLGCGPDFQSRQSVNSYPLNEGPEALRGMPEDFKYCTEAWRTSPSSDAPSNSLSSSGSDPSARGKQLLESAGVVGQTRSPGGEEAVETRPVKGGRGTGKATGKMPTAAALNQRRYHQRQKEKRAEYEAQLRDVARRMEEIQEENAELRLKQRHLLASMTTWQDHLESLIGNTEVRRQTQRATLRSMAELVSLATGRSISMEEAEGWTLGEYTAVHFPALIEGMAKLVVLAKEAPTSPAMAKVEELVHRQRKFKTEAGLGSCLHCAVNQYNQQHTSQQDTASLPRTSFWATVLEGMNLTQDQQRKIVDSYRWMHRALTACAEERNSQILPQLSFESAGTHREMMHRCPAAQQLFNSLRSEQTTVLGFYLAVEGTLSKWQEGFLECASYPWSPEWLQLCTLMCRNLGCEPLEFPVFANEGMDLPLLPYMTAFEVLKATVTSFGMGAQGRQAILMCPFQVVLSRYCFPTTDKEYMCKMKLSDVIVRSERTWSCWQWMERVKEVGRLLPNEICYGKS